MAVQAEALLRDPAAHPLGVGADHPLSARPEPAGGDRAQRDDALAPRGDVDLGLGAGVGPVGEHGAVGAGAQVAAGRRGAQRDAVGSVGGAHRAGEPRVERAGDAAQVRGSPRVPVVQHPVGMGSDHGDPLAGRQGEHAVIGEQHHGPGDSLPGECPVLGQVDLVGADAGIGVEPRIQLAGGQPQLEVAPHGLVDVRLGDQPAVERGGDPAGGGTGVGVVVGERVDARAEHRGVAGHVVGVVALEGDEVPGGGGVGHDEQRPGRPAPQLVEQLAGDVVGPPVHEVVGGHDGADDARLDGPAVGGQLVFAQHAGPQPRAGQGAVGLVVVGEEVLEGGDCAPEHGVVAAQPAGVRGGELGREVRVLGVALFVAAPARVAQRVHHGRPGVEADGRIGGVLGAQLDAHDLADPGEQLGGPGRREADGLREHCRGPEPGDAVQGLGPGVERP